jgi:hypothetical protein
MFLLSIILTTILHTARFCSKKSINDENKIALNKRWQRAFLLNFAQSLITPYTDKMHTVEETTRLKQKYLRYYDHPYLII